MKIKTHRNVSALYNINSQFYHIRKATIHVYGGPASVREDRALIMIYQQLPMSYHPFSSESVSSSYVNVRWIVFSRDKHQLISKEI